MSTTFEEHQRKYREELQKLYADAFNAKDGMFALDMPENEAKTKLALVNRSLDEVDYFYLDVVREMYGLDRDDESATFGEEYDKRWWHFFREHLIKKKDGSLTPFYVDKDNKIRVMPDEDLNVQDLEFMVMSKDFLVDDLKKEVGTPQIFVYLYGQTINIPPVESVKELKEDELKDPVADGQKEVEEEKEDISFGYTEQNQAKFYHKLIHVMNSLAEVFVGKEELIKKDPEYGELIKKLCI